MIKHGERAATTPRNHLSVEIKIISPSEQTSNVTRRIYKSINEGNEQHSSLSLSLSREHIGI